MSHVYMDNFFSSTDSRDEISTRIFGVIGKLNTEGLHMCVRAGKGGSFISLKVEDVFDTVHPHPTLTEAFVEAALASIGKAVHIWVSQSKVESPEKILSI